MGKGGIWKLILFIFIIIVLSVAVYFTFFFYYKCKNIECFKTHQEKCSKSKYIHDTEDATWLYYIKGKEDNKCEIKVEILEIKQGDLDKLILKGKTMDCYLTLGNLASPESDLTKCHGILKEELQNLIIEKLHAYIVENIGDISAELKKVI